MPIAQPQEPVVIHRLNQRWTMPMEGLTPKGAFTPDSLRRFYDESQVLACLQAIVNRTGPNLYLVYNGPTDEFWWDMWRQLDPAMATRPVLEINDLGELLRHYAPRIRGLVTWDESVPATSNVALTMAGLGNALAVRHDTTPDSVYTQLTRHGALPILHRLHQPNGAPRFTGARTGSAKNDAVRWGIDELVRTGRTNPGLLGYYIDAFWLRCGTVGWPINHTVTNTDYIMAHRGFLFDLHVYDDEVPVDDPGQKLGTDVRTLQLLLAACNDRLGDGMIHVAGYVPWRYKYTEVNENGWFAGGRYHGVHAEWRCTEILTGWNAWLDADALDYAAMVNASFHQHFPLPDKMPQNPAPDEAAMAAHGLLDETGRVRPLHYIAHYVGDYDAAAWLYWNLPKFWNDPARGDVPLSWAFNPVLDRRFPIGMYWTRTTRTPQDCFVSGDSGAGYVNPHHLAEPRPFSGLPSGLPRWEAHCRREFERWDLDVVGFIIDGHTPIMPPAAWDVYTRIAPGGIMVQRHPDPWGMHGPMPWVRHAGDLSRDSAADAAATVVGRMGPAGAGSFTCWRSVLMTPRYYVDVRDRVAAAAPHGDYRWVNMRELLWLVRRQAERGWAT